MVKPAENLARFGFRVSRAFAADLKQHGAAISRSPDLRRMFSTQDGKRIVREGDRISHLGLEIFSPVWKIWAVI